MPQAVHPVASRSTLAPAGQPLEVPSALVTLIRRSRRLLVLTGAGCSTDSGIPDYRDAQGAWKRSPPMQYQQFIASLVARPHMAEVAQLYRNVVSGALGEPAMTRVPAPIAMPSGNAWPASS